MDREMTHPEHEQEPLPENVREVFPGGFRVVKGETSLDVPETWVFYDGQGLLVLDPGGELPIETRDDEVSLKPLAALATGSKHSPKIEAVRELSRRFDAPIHGILLTHGDADHTNNIENVSGPDVPIYVGRKGWWSTLSPELQFAAGRVNLEKSPHTKGQSGDLQLRDLGFRAVAEMMNNPRGGAKRHERKQHLAARFRDFPQLFSLPEATVEVIPTPGHAPEEVGFFVPEAKVFIGGDLLTTSKPDQAGRMNLFLPEANVFEAIDSIRRLQELDLEQLYPAHGEPIVGRDAIQEYLAAVIADAEAIIERTERIHQEHPTLTVTQLRPRVFTRNIALPGMAPRSEETWILSILRDRPHVAHD